MYDLNLFFVVVSDFMRNIRWKIFDFFVFSLLIFSSFTARAQGSRLSITYTNPSGMSVCGDSIGFDINVRNISLGTVSSLRLTVQLPTGIEYVQGSVLGNGVSENSTSNLSAPIFNLPDLRVAADVTVRIRVKAGCGIIPDLNLNRLIRNSFRVDYTGNFDMASSIPYNVAQPNLRIQNVSNKFYTGPKGSTFIRTITLINSGQGPLDTFSFYQTNASGIQVRGVSGGYIRSSGDTIFSTFNASHFSQIGNRNGKLDRNESVTITDTLLLLGCASMASKYYLSWGCMGSACNKDQDVATANLTSINPDLGFSVKNSATTCIGGNQPLKNELKVFNKGNDTARYTAVNIFQALNGNGFWDAQFSRIDTASVRIRKGWNGNKQRAVFSDIKMNRSTGDWSCLGNDPVGAMDLYLGHLAPGDTFYIEFDQYSCCRTTCNNSAYIYGWRYNANYQDQCNKAIFSAENWGRVYDYTYLSLTSFNPTDIVDQETKLFTYTFTNYRLALQNSRSLMKMYFILPKGLSHSLNKNDFRILSINGTYWNPAQLTKSGDTLIAYFRGTRPINMTQAEIKIKLKADCTGNVHGDQRYNMSITYVSDSTCAQACVYPLHCSSGDIRIHCISGCNRGGMFFKNFDASRINYGLPDNDNNGLPDTSGNLDFDKIKTHRLMVGDTLRTRFSGLAYPAGTTRSWRFGKASSRIQYGSIMKVNGTRLRVYRRGNLMLDCQSVPYTVSTLGSWRTFNFDISISSVANSCAIGTYYQYGTYDSIDLQVDYVYETNPGGVFRSAVIENEFYLSTTANPSSNSQKFQCDTFSGIFQQVGYYMLNYARGNYVHTGCGEELVTQNYYLSVGNCCGNYAGGNIFPFEYRNWGNISKFKAIIPKGYSFSRALLYHYVTAGTGQTRREYVSSIPLSRQIGDTLVLNMDSLYSDKGGPLTLGDDGFYGIVYLYLNPSCEVEDNKSLPVDYLIEFRERNAMGSGITPITTNNGVYTDYVRYEHPVLKVYPIESTVPGNSDTISWRLLIRNEHGTSHASNVWLGASMLNGLSITGATDTFGNPLNYSNGLLKLGDIRASSHIYIDLQATFTNCDLDSMRLELGWNCSGYPNQMSQYPCPTSNTWLYVRPENTQLQSKIKGSSGDLKLCQSEWYEIEVSNVDFVKAYGLGLDISLPYGSTIDSGSSLIVYPQGNTPKSINNPVLVSGNRWRWDLSTLSEFAKGFPGISDTSKNSFVIRFQLNTDCNFSSGSFFYVQPVAKIKCGRSVIAPISIGDPMNIDGVKRPYFADLKVDLDTLQTCSDGGYTTVRLLILGPDSTGSSDSYQITLPEGILIDTSWFIGYRNAPNRIPQLQNINGNTLVTYNLPKGIAPGDSCFFSFKIEPDPSRSSCGAVQFFSQSVVKQPALCVSSNTWCNINVATGTDLNLNSISKAAFNFSAISATSLPANGGEQVMLKYRLTNTGAENDSLNYFYVKVFDDVNQNRHWDAGEPHYGTDTLKFQMQKGVAYNRNLSFFAPDTSICRLKLIIDSLNCVCEPFIANIPYISLKNAGKDTSMCSGDSVLIGINQSAAYRYSWSPSTGIAKPDQSSSLMTIRYTEKGVKDFSYILTSYRNGCSSKDTIVLSVKPGIELNMPNYEKLCKGNYVVIGSPPQGGSGSFRYQWSPTDSLKYPNLSKSQAWPDTTTLYTLSVTDYLGCTSTASTLVEVVRPPEAYFFKSSGCEKDELLIRDSITQFDADVDSLYWDFGDGSFSINGFGLSHSYLAEGKYPVRLFIRDTNNCTDVFIDTMQVFGLPTVVLKDTFACAGDSIQMIPTASVSSGNMLSDYEWLMDMNYYSAPTLTISKPNRDSLKIVVKGMSDKGCSNADTALVIFHPPPMPVIRDTGICLGSDIALNASADSFGFGLTSFNWKLGNGQSYYGRHGSVTYSDTGKYVLELGVLNDKGCSGKDSALIRVYDLPIPQFKLNDICLGDSVHLVSTSSVSMGGIQDVSWLVNGQANAADSFWSIPTDTGVHVVKLLVRSGNSCSDSMEKTYRVYPLPVPKIAATDICLGETVQFADQFKPAGTLFRRWMLAGDSVGNNSNYSLAPSTAGKITIKLVNLDLNGCEAADSFSVEVHALPIPDFDLNNPCDDHVVLLTEQSTAGSGSIVSNILRDENGRTWSFPFPDTLRFNNTGSHQLVLQVENSFGCRDSMTKQISTYPKPKLRIVSDTFCEKTEAELIAKADYYRNGNHRFDWSLGDGQTFEDQEKIRLSFNDYGSMLIQLSLTYPDGCTYLYDSTIQVHPLPIAGFRINPERVNIVNPAIQLWDESTGASNWLYFMGDGSLSNEASFNYEYADSGTYLILQQVRSEFGCFDTAQRSLMVDFYNTRYMPDAFSPNGDGLNDLFAPVGRGIHSYRMRIYNRWGELIFDTEIGQAFWDGTYKGKAVPPGLYAYQVTLYDHKLRETHLSGSLTLIR